jgi:putative FmdB family regulatory protein
MPIYEYRCNDCKATFEVIQKFSDDPIKKCIHCSGAKIKKLISHSSFVLKGGGWFQDGYAKKKPEKKEKEKKADAPKPDCSSSSSPPSPSPSSSSSSSSSSSE